MPKATKKSNCVTDTYANEDQEEFSNEQEASSENELQEDYNNLNESQENLDVTHESSSDQEVVFNPKPSTSKKVHHSGSRSVQIPTQQQAYMPYIEGPK